MTKFENTLNPRSKKVLFATIAEYVATGTQVSSGALTKNQRLGMSSATIRRHLHQLTEQGYLVQPHTSAGRIPTDRAYRLFVDTLKKQPGQIQSAQREKLAVGFNNLLPGVHDSWQDIVRLLSELSLQTALVVTPSFSDAVLRQLRFIPSGPGSLLAVVITREGLVHNAVIEVTDQMADPELERVHNYLSELIEGRTLNEIRHLLRDELDDARKRCDLLREKATLLGAQAIRSSVDAKPELVVDGRSRLLSQPELKENAEELMRFLEERSLILELLDKAAATDRGPLVIIGREGGENLDGCSIITSPFGSGNTEGQIGVLGSTRMDYSTVIPLVALSAQILSSFFDDES